MVSIYRRVWEIFRSNIERSRRQTLSKNEIKAMMLSAMEQALREADDAIKDTIATGEEALLA